jgi:hypothetical protein
MHRSRTKIPRKIPIQREVIEVEEEIPTTVEHPTQPEKTVMASSRRKVIVLLTYDLY